MAAPDINLYEYALVRYVPRVDRGEFVNIGLVMMCRRRRWLRGEIRLDAGRIKALYPRADLAVLERQASVFTRDDVPSKDIPVEERYRWLTAVKSAVLQVTPSHPGLLCASEGVSDSDGSPLPLDAEFDRLFRTLVC